MEDLRSMYGEDFQKEILETEFASEIIQSIDNEIITYSKHSQLNSMLSKDLLGMPTGIVYSFRRYLPILIN